MSVESEILRIQHNIANAYAAVSQKGGEVPLQPTSENLTAAVESIPQEAAGDVYSTKETRVGTWIDGKPLYRRVFQSTTPSTTEDQVLALNADYQVKKISGYLTVASQNISVTPASGPWSAIYVKYNSLWFFTSAASYQGIPILCIVEYTKATDQATIGAAEIAVTALDGLSEEDVNAMAEAAANDVSAKEDRTF